MIRSRSDADITGWCIESCSRFDVGADTIETDDITLGSSVLGLHADAGWRHAFGDLTPITSLAFNGSSTFAIQGVPLAQDGASYGAGIDMSVAKDVLVGVSYDGQYAPTANDNTIKLNLDWKL